MEVKTFTLQKEKKKMHFISEIQHNAPPKPKQLQMYSSGRCHAHNEPIHGDFAEAT